MRARWRWLPAVVGVVALFAACSSDAFTTSAGDASTDGAVTSPDGSADDGRAGSDADDDADASVDASDAAPIDPCKTGTPHTLCDDFDGPTLSLVWSGQPTCNSSVLANDDAVSPPNALASIGGGDSSIACDALSSRLVTDGSPKGMTCEFDFRYLGTPAGETTFFALQTYGAGVDYYTTSFTLTVGAVTPVSLAFVYAQNGGPQMAPTSLELPGLTDLSVWHHMKVDVDFSSGVFTVTTDHAATSSSTTPQGFPAGTVTTVAVDVGLPYVAPGASAVLREDDVVCDLR